MLRVANISVPLCREADRRAFELTLKKLRIPESRVTEWHVSKKSVDARDKAKLCFVYAVDIGLENEDDLLKHLKPGTASKAPEAQPLCCETVTPKANRPVVVGLGPCGLFAALYLARAGLRPICLERGQRVEDRKKSVQRFFADGTLDPESNVQFGEGGAGAFSDGKLTTGIKDPACRQVLEELVRHGAPENILYEAHPHVGTDRLPGAVAAIREEIIALGGEVRFETKLLGLVSENGTVRALHIKDSEGESELPCDSVILALGHSARDTVRQLYADGLRMEQKPFSVGVRAEHPQVLVNRSQYGKAADSGLLGAAEYHIHVKLPDGRGVYSFCMCPGGQVIAAASEEGGVCTNGMSVFARDGENANAALLVDVRTEDFPSDHPLAGIEMQREWEHRAFAAGGSNYRAPAQRMEDFLNRRPSTFGGPVQPSYRPGVTWTSLDEVLPAFAAESLRAGIPLLKKQLHCIDLPDAVLTGIEARSSSPVRIPRDETLQSTVRGVFPAGEGAGYAGGIMSAAVDGLRAAKALIRQY